MSASSFTDWQIQCDQGGCKAQAWATELTTSDPTATAARRILRKRGWRVNMLNPSEGGSPRRLDFCPDHAYLTETTDHPDTNNDTSIRVLGAEDESGN